ncbi:MAG: hypothetical protein JEZ04_20495 [Spirochaetales bacterium]|nr:hypothetical protein [Spirochaetales bacterium]
MKKSFLLLILTIVIIIVISCTTPGSDAGGEPAELRFSYVKYEEIGALLSEWEQVIRSGDHTKFTELVWPDVKLEFRNRKGIQTDFQGLDAVKRVRLDFLRTETTAGKYMLPEPNSYEDHNDSNQSYGFLFEPSGISEWIHFRKKEGEWRIQHMEVGLPVPGSWVTNRFQSLADQNHDGFLQGQERQVLFDMSLRFFAGPHESVSELDEMLDGNDDGFIDKDEITGLTKAFFKDGLMWFKTFSPQWAVNQLDLNGDGSLSDKEIDQIYAYMSNAMSLEEVQPGGSELGKWLDKNSDGKTEKDELREGFGYFLGNVIGFVIPDALSQEVPREVSNYIDRLADADNDGRIDRIEHNELLKSTRLYHEVESYIDKALDRRHSGMVDHNDILLVLQTSAAGSAMLEAAIKPPYTVTTPYDRFLDTNSDDEVSAEELTAAVLLFSGVKAAQSKVSVSLKMLCDWNDDGEIENREIRQAAGVLLLPHPVNPKEPLDVSGDANGDGFIEPSELGISGGYSDEGEFMTLEALVRLSVYKMVQNKTSQAESPGETTEGFKSEYYQRLGLIQDRKLAIINFDNQTEGLNNETSAGIIMFVENAFVNVGKVRVIERKHVEEILDEYKFQSSALIDEETAIEVGKLSGAEIIVIGSINRVGGTFYLNIKLIDVKTAEIIGSNIARADRESEFLDMCNEAVYLLF